MVAAPNWENVREKWMHLWELIFLSLCEKEKHVTSFVCSQVAVDQDKNLKSATNLKRVRLLSLWLVLQAEQ